MEISPARQLSGSRKLSAPRVVKAREAALRGVRPPTLLAAAVTCANDVRAGNATLRIPLTGGLKRRGGLLTLPSASASTTTTPTAAAPATSTPAAATTTSASAAASTTTPTAAVSSPTAATSLPSRASTPTASTPTSSAATPTPAPLVPAAPARSRRGPDLLSTKKVDSTFSEATEGRRGEGEHPSKNGVRGSPREVPTATMLASAASSSFSRRATVSSVGERERK
ncbi:unnamed protein product [Closterium sp. Yama58-4]|nr:unnamed protein product [Closterium sp. Yama58-4]